MYPAYRVIAGVTDIEAAFSLIVGNESRVSEPGLKPRVVSQARRFRSIGIDDWRLLQVLRQQDSVIAGTGEIKPPRQILSDSRDRKSRYTGVYGDDRDCAVVTIAPEDIARVENPALFPWMFPVPSTAAMSVLTLL